MNKDVVQALILFCVGFGFFFIFEFIAFLAFKILQEEDEKNNKPKE